MPWPRKAQSLPGARQTAPAWPYTGMGPASREQPFCREGKAAFGRTCRGCPHFKEADAVLLVHDEQVGPPVQLLFWLRTGESVVSGACRHGHIRPHDYAHQIALSVCRIKPRGMLRQRRRGSGASGAPLRAGS